MRTALTRIATWATALVAGAVYGAAGAVSHAYAVAGIPVGLVLSIVGFAALLVGIRLVEGSRWTVVAAGLGAVVATIVLSGTGPGGSVIVPTDPLSIAWEIAVPAVAVLAVVWPERRRVSPPPGPVEAPR